MDSAIDSFDVLLSKDHYIARSHFDAWASENSQLKKSLPAWLLLFPGAIPLDNWRKLFRFLSRFKKGPAIISRRNSQYVLQQVTDHAAFFDTLESYPLTQRQREAIVTDENNNLVIAGAGTGKTSTIVGKTAFIIKKEWAKPDEILLLAFTRKAKEEMEFRLQGLLPQPPAVHTFHSLGLEILGHSSDSGMPSVSKMAEDEKALHRFIQEHLNSIIANERLGHTVITFLAYHLNPRKSEFAFASHGDHIHYLKSHNIRTLKNELVKSYGECLIANWLLLNGIDYSYEEPYAIRVNTRDRRQYRPDFFLPGKRIYIEYFGLDRLGDPPQYVDKAEYLRGMEWKRGIHSRFRTPCIEVFYHDLQDGVLAQNLRRELQKRGVTFKPPSREQLKAALEKPTSQLAVLLGTFLHQFKSSGDNLDDLRRKISSAPDAPRMHAFLNTFKLCFEEYQKTLRAAGEIDFEDMINLATDAVASGRWRSNFRYVLVDEFQDISHCRARLLKALLGANKHSHSFCVGDDWQSIFRFAGSDVRIMTDFPQEFGETAQTALEDTFRFNKELLRVSSAFVQKNPLQIKKDLKAKKSIRRPAVCMLPTGDKTLRWILHEIREENAGQERSVFIVGRYWSDCPNEFDGLRQSFFPLKLTFTTIHSAKGLEADYVIVMNLSAGRRGFPTEIVDDPILGLALPASEDFPNAEERRLLYVAMTRARHRAFLLYDQFSPSSFVQELNGREYSKLVRRRGHSAAKEVCPKCKSGFPVEQHGRFGKYRGCSNFPYCRHTWP
jgi:DNA helicase-4